MSYKIMMTDTAKEDLRQIATYIAEESKEKSIAINFVKELQQSVQVLSDFPESGAYPKDRFLQAVGYRYLVHKEYLTFYTVDKENEQVNIVAVFNAKKDYMRVLKNIIL